MLTFLKEPTVDCLNLWF